MEISLLLLLLGFAVVVFLIFKFIKKMVFAVLSLVILVVIILASIGGLVYLDYNYLVSQQDYEVKVLYQQDDDYVVGLNIPIEDNEPVVEELSGIEEGVLTNIEPQSIDSDSGEFNLIITEPLLDELLSDEPYVLPGAEDFEGLDINLSLTPQEVKSLITSDNAEEELKEIIIENNDISEVERIIVEPIIDSFINAGLSEAGMGVNEMAFSLVLYTALEDEKNIVTLVEAFKEDELQVYPDRFSFNFVRILPIDTLTSVVSDDEELVE